MWCSAPKIIYLPSKAAGHGKAHSIHAAWRYGMSPIDTMAKPRVVSTQLLSLILCPCSWFIVQSLCMCLTCLCKVPLVGWTKLLMMTHTHTLVFTFNFVSISLYSTFNGWSVASLQSLSFLALRTCSVQLVDSSGGEGGRGQAELQRLSTGCEVLQKLGTSALPATDHDHNIVKLAHSVCLSVPLFSNYGTDIHKGGSGTNTRWLSMVIYNRHSSQVERTPNQVLR